MGFAPPLDKWLLGPLKEWVESLIDEKKLKMEGYFDADKVTLLWKKLKMEIAGGIINYGSNDVSILVG